jgi:hypothetical protein
MKFLKFWPIIHKHGADIMIENQYITPHGFYTIDGCDHHLGYTCEEKDKYARCIECGWLSTIRTQVDKELAYFIIELGIRQNDS